MSTIFLLAVISTQQNHQEEPETGFAGGFVFTHYFFYGRTILLNHFFFL